jgi:hypothetical protein
MEAEPTSSAGYPSTSFHHSELFFVCMYTLLHLNLTMNYLAKVRFHWIFAESHHGKGEHDGHGATVKYTFRFYVLGGLKPTLHLPVY